MKKPPGDPHDSWPEENGQVTTWQDVCRRAGASYFLLQGLLGALWWAGLFLFPPSRTWFAPGELLDVVFLPDVLVFVLGSFVAAILARRATASAVIASAMVTGAALYVALLLIGVSLTAGRGGLGAKVMIPNGSLESRLAAFWNVGRER